MNHFPIAESDREHAGSSTHATRTFENRPPKAGEWYLSGAIPEAYRAPNDLSAAFHILKLEAKPELQARLQEALGLEDADFAYHATDLYVVNKPGVLEWLTEHHPHPENIGHFAGQEGADWNGAGKACLDIPFFGNWPTDPQR